MAEIRCPKCGEVFQVDESGYAAILHQVRDDEFLRELKDRENSLLREKASELKLAVSEAEAQKDKELAELRARLASEQERSAAAAAKAQADREAALAALRAQEAERVAALQQELTRLSGQSELEKEKAKAAVETAVRGQEAEIIKLRGELELEKNRAALQEKTQREAHEAELRRKDEEIAYYKDFKARQSTKMVGESLEQHCETEFNRIRATAFPNAYFEKDNDARTGSKGDFIYRESTPDGVEVLSIMFEMKNEMETTAAKHKNEDFFKELDKDRREKNCEYAVLVSLLEADSELYNAGIVDVSHRYEKMYVVRPQFFIPIISLLRNAAMGAVETRRELARVRAQNIDVTNFEEKMRDFKEDFTANVERAGRKFQDAIDEIDKTIDHLQKVRSNLVSSDRQLQIANRKVGDLSIKRLTRGNPTMKEKFEEARRKDEEWEL
ncbi:MAG: DUF2130 domain-containing protein [Lachnospiraceae bacterium]|nr:DUF2130 domain-containing protein [Lachnospiraceae bacterium]